MSIYSFTIPYVLLGIVGAVLHLDRTYVLQVMISRPLIASSIAGAILGDVLIGLTAGMTLELLWLGIQPLGTSIPPHDTLVSLVAPSAVILSLRIVDTPQESTLAGMIALSILLSLPLGEIGRIADIQLRKKNGTMLAEVKEEIGSGDVAPVARKVFKSIGMAGICFFVLSLISVALITMILALVVPLLPERLWTGLEIICLSIPIFGVVSMIAAGMSPVRFGVSFLAACAALFLIVGVV
ncbi:MAG: PTS sugar transporter subunit IIC [Deltaproteobacteria bacterium]|nr:PTS sugar transporter subunit IIC [Candidatus Zymogenaceae bacterium]